VPARKPGTVGSVTAISKKKGDEVSKRMQLGERGRFGARKGMKKSEEIKRFKSRGAIKRMGKTGETRNLKKKTQQVQGFLGIRELEPGKEHPR